MNTIRTSIVVLCYNGLEETTRPCLNSIIANTSIDDYELIIVDNASSDGTAEYLKTFACQYPHVRLQLNDSNKGYSGGNNDGIRLSKGQSIILLNNDTLVPAGWLDRLLRLFNEQPKVGLIGPVTNSAGNEQRIELAGLNEHNFEKIAGAYIAEHKGAWATTEKLGFFCVALRREVLDNIGYLDENFGIGMFEDDDYCIRAIKAGFSLAIVDDCFVYHKGSVSFKKLASNDYIELFNKNRDYFFKKNNILWSYTDIASNIWIKIRNDLTIANKDADRKSIERILVRINAMDDALYQLKEVEKRAAVVDGKSFIETELAEKQRSLMELSDWATHLKQENEALIEKQKIMTETFDWASSMKQEIDEMSRSWYYRLFRFLRRWGI